MRAFFFATLIVLLLAGSLRVFALPQSPVHATGKKVSQTSPNKKPSGDEGEQRFKANCGRCHNPPNALSPREVKAVLQHMRVRAMLSAEDEELIRKFLAP